MPRPSEEQLLPSIQILCHIPNKQHGSLTSGSLKRTAEPSFKFNIQLGSPVLCCLDCQLQGSGAGLKESRSACCVPGASIWNIDGGQLSCALIWKVNTEANVKPYTLCRLLQGTPVQFHARLRDSNLLCVGRRLHGGLRGSFIFRLTSQREPLITGHHAGRSVRSFPEKIAVLMILIVLSRGYLQFCRACSVERNFLQISLQPPLFAGFRDGIVSACV